MVQHHRGRVRKLNQQRGPCPDYSVALGELGIGMGALLASVEGNQQKKIIFQIVQWDNIVQRFNLWDFKWISWNVNVPSTTYTVCQFLGT